MQNVERMYGGREVPKQTHPIIGLEAVANYIDFGGKPRGE